MTKVNTTPALFRNSQGGASIPMTGGRPHGTTYPNSIPELGSERLSGFKVGVARALAWICIVLGSSAVAQPREPQAKGQARASGAPAVTLVSSWPDTGPRRLWRRPLGEGESGIVWSAGMLYTMFRKGRNENVVAITAETGELVWEREYNAPLTDRIYTKHGSGPHATPLVTKDKVVTVGISGLLHCLDKQDGRILWLHDLMREYRGRPADCGYSATPVLFEDTVILPVGGTGNAIMAFRLADGRVVWKRHSMPIGYATPIIVDVGGEDQLIVFMGQEVVGLDPRDGSLKWRHPHKTDHGVNASRPVWGNDSTLFISSAYGVGTRALRLVRTDVATEVNELWHQRKMQVHFGTFTQIGDYLYGTSGDFGPVFLTTVNAKTGELIRQERDIVKKASMLNVDGRLLMLDEDGFLILATVSPEGVTVHARHQITKGRAWTAPTLVGTTIYVRDQTHMMAYDLG